VSRIIVALQVLEAAERNSRTARFVTFVHVVSRAAVAEDVADDGGMVWGVNVG
jgi:hypothetical protein